MLRVIVVLEVYLKNVSPGQEPVELENKYGVQRHGHYKK